MGTGARKSHVYLKKFLSQQQMTDNFLEYLLAQSRDNLALLYPEEGVFSGGVISGSSSDEISVSTPLTATDGLGRLLKLDPLNQEATFENALGVDYYVGLRYAEIYQETEVNPRTGRIEYTFFEEAIGEKAEPSSVVDNGSTLTIGVDSVTEAGVSNAGRSVLIWLKQAAGQADAFYTGTVVWDGSNNTVNTTHLLGQTAGLVSTDTTDYQVFLIGPTIKRNTDLSADPNVVFLGTVTGAGTGNVPTTFDQTGMNKLFPSGTFGAIEDEVKSFLVGGGLIEWDLDSQTLTWASDLVILIPHKSHNFSIAAGSQASIADGDILYIDASLPGGAKSLVKVSANSMPNVSTAYPIGIRYGNDFYFRDGALELKGSAGDTTSGRINDITQDLLTFIGADSESDSDPDYSTIGAFAIDIIDQGDPLKDAIDKIHGNVAAIANNNPGEEEVVVGAGGQSVFAISGFTFSSDNSKFDVEAYIDGRRMRQDAAGGLAKDFRKISTTQIEFSFTVPEGKTVTFWKQGTAYGGAYPPSAGQLWSDPVDAPIIPTSDAGLDLGSSIRRFKEGHVKDLYMNYPIIVSDLGNLLKIKQMVSGHVATLTAGTPASQGADGKVYPADADGASGRKYIGIIAADILVGGTGPVLLTGLNVPGVLTGLGFAPGDDIYIGEIPGTYTNNPGAFSGLDDDIVRVGIASCATGVASALATDLIMFNDVVARI